jgi:hypothetical protein
MKIERSTLQACCGGKSIIFKTGVPLTMQFLDFLKANGFREAEHFTKAGIIYADNPDLIVTGPIGSNRLQVKCRLAGQESECDQKLNDFEEFLLKQG